MAAASAPEEGLPPSSGEFVAKLGAMKMRALQRRAEELGVDEEKLENAEVKSEVIGLIVAKVEEQVAKAETKAKRIAALKEELGSMKMRALQRRAEEEELGVETNNATGKFEYFSRTQGAIRDKDTDPRVLLLDFCDSVPIVGVGAQVLSLDPNDEAKQFLVVMAISESVYV